MKRGLPSLYLGVDVGTGSVRAGLFDGRGRMAGHASHPIRIWREGSDFAEQSSQDIWSSAGRAVRGALRESGARGAHVAGLGFDATCSLVSLDERDRPVTVSPSGQDQRNVILWMDHRAGHQAQRANATRSPVLRYVGGSVSVEMEIPKLLWLRTNLPKAWRRSRRFFDLADFLTYSATGSDARSLCTLACKWNYLGHKGEGLGWDEDGYFRKLGLLPLLREKRIGTSVVPLGTEVGGLLPRAARDLGLEPGLPVAAGIIDAHAGGVGLLGLALSGQRQRTRDQAFDSVLALIGGTSSCHMAVSRKPRFVPGVWGPYFGAMVPGLWLNEGGQSATGALVDHVLEDHAASGELKALSRASGRTVYEVINARLERLAAKSPRTRSRAWLLARDVHLLGDHHGNRSPRADPLARGLVSGLSLDRSLDDLALRYLATVQALAYGTRHIIQELNRKGYRIRSLLATGGGTKNPLWLQTHADATGCRLVLGREEESVLLGSAIQGAVAAGAPGGYAGAMATMSSPGRRLAPNSGSRAFHDAKFGAYLSLYDHQRSYSRAMSGF